MGCLNLQTEGWRFVSAQSAEGIPPSRGAGLCLDFPKGKANTRDPIGEQGGYNLYAMLGNDPVGWWDRWGLWTKDGVLKILCSTPEGKKIVNNVLSRYNIYSYKSYTYKRQYCEYKAKTIKNGSPDTINGYHRRRPLMGIGVYVDFSDKRAASTFLHEGVHGRQYDEYDERLKKNPAATAPTKAEKEYEAHIGQEKFNIAKGIPPKDPTFRVKDPATGKWVADEAAIKKWVDKVYGIGPKVYFKNYGYKLLGKKGPIKGWCCP